jgi:hypothetical protein
MSERESKIFEVETMTGTVYHLDYDKLRWHRKHKHMLTVNPCEAQGGPITEPHSYPLLGIRLHLTADDNEFFTDIITSELIKVEQVF